MERFIFRAKRKDNGEWVHGQYLSCGGTHTIVNSTMTFIHECENKGYADSWNIDPDTLGQSTGLKDKNGKLIYEHDVVLAWNEKLIVFWHDKNASWGVIGIGMYPKRNSGEVCSNGTPLCGAVSFDCEVIGNIHD